MKDTLLNPNNFKYIVLSLDLLLSLAIILVIPYTEIDWQAYMQQSETFLNGERTYTNIEGGTGPVVYPALHLYVYSALYKLTSNGTNIILAQLIFVFIYLLNQYVVLSIYDKLIPTDGL